MTVAYLPRLQSMQPICKQLLAIKRQSTEFQMRIWKTAMLQRWIQCQRRLHVDSTQQYIMLLYSAWATKCLGEILPQMFYCLTSKINLKKLKNKPKKNSLLINRKWCPGLYDTYRLALILVPMQPLEVCFLVLYAGRWDKFEKFPQTSLAVPSEQTWTYTE